MAVTWPLANQWTDGVTVTAVDLQTKVTDPLNEVYNLAVGPGQVAAGGCVFPSNAYSAVGFVRMTGTVTDDSSFPNQYGVANGGAASTLVVPVAGIYAVQGVAAFAAGSASGVNRRCIAVSDGTGGSPSANNIQLNVQVAGTGSTTMEIAGILRLAAGAVLSLYRYTDLANSYGAGNGTLRATLIG